MKGEFIFNTVEFNDNVTVNCPAGYYYDVDEYCLKELQKYATAHGITIAPVVFMGYKCDNKDFDLDKMAFYSNNDYGIVYKLDDRYPVILEEK